MSRAAVVRPRNGWSGGGAVNDLKNDGRNKLGSAESLYDVACNAPQKCVSAGNK